MLILQIKVFIFKEKLYLRKKDMSVREEGGKMHS